MAANLRIRNKVASVLRSLTRRFPTPTFPVFEPPPQSADASAALAVASKNSEIIAGAVLGLHGPPQEGADAARKLMSHCVDWNEVRVARSDVLLAMLGKDPRATERIALLQRFLETFFLRQRNLNLEYLVPLRPGERRSFVSNLEVFSRDELAAFLLTCFRYPLFPPDEILLQKAMDHGIVKPKTTALQMARQFETSLTEDQMLQLYTYLYAEHHNPPKGAEKKKKKK